MSHPAFPSPWRRSAARAAGLTSLLVAAGIVLPAAAADWPCFRGPGFDGIYAGKLPVEDGRPIGLHVAWQRPLGSGYSGVSVADDRVVTMFSDGESDVVIALDERDGRELWRFDMGPTYEGHDGSHTGPISTPLIAANRVFALSAQGRFVALALDSGELAWSVDLTEALGAEQPFYGFGTSPFSVEGVVIVGVGGEKAAYAAFDPATGKPAWTVGSDTVQYQSPALFDWDGRPHLLLASDKNLHCVDPASGETVWTREHGGGPRGGATTTPIPLPDHRVFLNAKFQESSVVLELFGAGADTDLKPVWEDRSIRKSYNIPVYHAGNLYGYSSRFLTCVDPATGEQRWRSRAPGDGFAMVADGRLVILTKEGSLHLARATPEGYSELARVEVFEDLAWSPPTVAHGRIYARSLDAIARIDVRSDAAAASSEPTEPATVPGKRLPRFLAEVAAAEDKSAVVDRFLASVDSFPLIEPPDVVHFLYRGGTGDMAVAGDFVGARRELPMKRVEGTDLFYYSTKLEPDVRLNYVFFEGYKPVPDPRNPRKCETTTFSEDMNMNFTGNPLAMSWFAMPKWKRPKHLADPSGPRGRIESHEIESEALGKKHTIDVYLPPQYDAGEHPFPVVYVHGGNDARTYGRFVETLDNVIGTTVRPLIAVFINEGSSRQPKYTDMLAGELIPFMDQKYRTIADADGRANYGAGFSAFDAVICTLKKPGTVQRLGLQSPFMFDSMRARLGELPSAGDLPLKIYIEWGRYDLRSPHEAWDTRVTARDFVNELRRGGHQVAGGEVLDGTGWPSWQNRVNVVLQTLFPI